MGIHPDDQELTTFLLPSGKYCYRRAPQGLSVSSDEWCQASDTALRYVPNMCKMVDDMCLYGETKEEILDAFTKMMEACAHSNITLSKGKVRVIKRRRPTGILRANNQEGKIGNNHTP